MGVFSSIGEWVSRLFSSGQKETGTEAGGLYFTMSEMYFRNLSFWTCVNLITAAVNKCEFKTFRKGKEEKKKEYYRWNIAPNKEQNASQFRSQLIAHLYEKNQALIVEHNKELYIANSFIKERSSTGEVYFSNVFIKKEVALSKNYPMGEVLYFTLHNEDMKALVNSMYNTYQELIKTSVNSYQYSRAKKVMYKHGTLPLNGTEERKKHDENTKKKFEALFSPQNAVIPLGAGEELENHSEPKTYSHESTRDIRAMLDDVSDFTAKAFLIPPSLIRGDVQDTGEATHQFISFCVEPLILMIQQEINRVSNGEVGFLAGNRLEISPKRIIYIDIIKNAASIDKLIASGVYCINDVRKLVGEEPIDQEWASQHFMTKNYSNVEDVIRALEGGGVH